NRFRASVAQMVAKVVARRTTRQDEIPQLMQAVELALTDLERRPEPKQDAVVTVAPPPRVRGPRLIRVREDVPEAEAAAEPAAPPPPPRLLRRADVVQAATQDDIP